MDSNSKARFSKRVEDYVKYRPGYPKEIIDLLQKEYGLTKDKLIADIGAGTGISAEMFLKEGYKVIAVEPNVEMRNKSAELLSSYEKFIAVDGSAEATTLADNSVDAIVAGQAFHWFDVVKCKEEFKRILVKNGLLVLIWNERKTASAFEKEYDEFIIQHAIDYVKVDHRNIDTASIEAFYNPALCQLNIFPNKQVFDYAGLEGRLRSSSYMPLDTEPGYDAMIDGLKELFNGFQKNNTITIEYDTKVYSGRL